MMTMKKMMLNDQEMYSKKTMRIFVSATLVITCSAATKSNTDSNNVLQGVYFY